MFLSNSKKKVLLFNPITFFLLLIFVILETFQSQYEIIIIIIRKNRDLIGSQGNWKAINCYCTIWMLTRIWKMKNMTQFLIIQILKKCLKFQKQLRNNNEKRGLPNISLSYLNFLKAYLPYLCSIVKYVILNATMDI